MDRIKYSLGLNEIFIFPSQPDDSIGHIDMQAKLLNKNTALVGKWESNDSDYQILDDNAQSFLNLGYNVIRIPMLRNPSPGGANKSDLWTYTNSLIINGIHKKIILVPIYNIPEDIEVINIYKQAMPDYEIREVDSTAIITEYGAIHCTTNLRPVIN